MTSIEPRLAVPRLAIESIGDSWTLLIVQEALNGVTRFEQWIAALSISRATLSRRLRLLVGIGILSRNRYSTRPARYEYHLTSQGRELLSVFAALDAWYRATLATS